MYTDNAGLDATTAPCPPHHWQIFANEEPAREYWECSRCHEVRLPHQYRTEPFSPPAKWATFTDEDMACLGGGYDDN